MGNINENLRLGNITTEDAMAAKQAYILECVRKMEEQDVEITEKNEQIAEKDEQIAEKNEQLVKKDEEIQILKKQLEELKNNKFS